MREQSSKRHRSASRERDSERRREKSHKSRRYKKSKKSRKRSRRSSSTSSSSSSSSESRKSDYRSSSSRKSRTRAASSESNSRTSRIAVITSSENLRTSVIPPKTIDLTNDHVKETLATIEEDVFEVKPFYSTRDREAPNRLVNKLVIDLTNETVQIPRPIVIRDITDEQMYHPNFSGDPELKLEKWIRKLFNFRRRHCQY